MGGVADNVVSEVAAQIMSDIVRLASAGLVAVAALVCVGVIIVIILLKRRPKRRRRPRRKKPKRRKRR